jgi:HEAT repeat protein
MRRPRLRFTVRRLMVAVAVVGVLLWAWLYRREHGDVERSLTSMRLRSFSEGDEAHRRMAVENLGNTQPAQLRRVLPVLAAAAADDDWPTRLAAVRSTALAAGRWRRIRVQDTGEEIASAKRILIRALDDPRDEVRLEAVRSLDRLSSPPQPTAGKPSRSSAAREDQQAVAPLLRLMGDRLVEIRAAAVLAFARIRPESGEGLDPVIRMLTSDPEARCRIAAEEALTLGWPDYDGIYPLLLARLEEVNTHEERAAIGWAFASLPTPPPEAIPALLDAMALDEFALNRNIPDVLAKLGPAARPALPALAKLAARECAEPMDSAMSAARAVASIDRDSAEARALLAPLSAMLQDATSPFRRQQAAWVLGLYGPSAAAAVPALRRALKSDVADVRQRTAWLLGSIGPAARPALADLSALADHDPEDNVRLTAAQAAKRIDTE